MNKNKTVLVISDGHEQFASTASLLRNEGFSVRFGNGMADSLLLAGAEAPHLIISELAVPNVDGLQLCRRVREDQELGATPILLVGDLSKRSSIVEDGFRCGAADYVQKPIDPLALADMCREILAPGKDASVDEDEDLFNSLIGNISEAITIVSDDDGTILFESPTTARIFGYGPDELLGTPMIDLIHPADRREAAEYFDSVHWGFGISPPVEYRMCQNDGTWKLFVSTGRAIDDPRFGRAIVLTSSECAVREFSFERVIENEILRSAVFGRAGIGLALFSMSGHLVEWNPALEEMLDLPGSTLNGMALSEFVYPFDAENDRRALADVLSGKRGHYQFENGYLTPDSSRVWGDATILNIADGDNAPGFLIGVFEDPAKKDSMAAIPVPDRTTRTSGDEYGASGLPDFKSWKIDKGLISEN